MKSISKEDCGCEFITLSDENGSCTFLHKCRCKKHYNEQFYGKWYDGDGNLHEDEIEPSNPLPLEEE